MLDKIIKRWHYHMLDFDCIFSKWTSRVLDITYPIIEKITDTCGDVYLEHSDAKVDKAVSLILELLDVDFRTKKTQIQFYRYFYMDVIYCRDYDHMYSRAGQALTIDDRIYPTHEQYIEFEPMLERLMVWLSKKYVDLSWKPDERKDEIRQMVIKIFIEDAVCWKR